MEYIIISYQCYTDSSAMSHALEDLSAIIANYFFSHSMPIIYITLCYCRTDTVGKIKINEHERIDRIVLSH